MRAVHAGEAVCPGQPCALLFRCFEQEATSVRSATIHPRLGLTRVEQQIVPLIAQGLTNKEIAKQICLSEQTVKSYLYRMKHKVGAGDRFGNVHLCRTEGFWFSASNCMEAPFFLSEFSVTRFREAETSSGQPQCPSRR